MYLQAKIPEHLNRRSSFFPGRWTVIVDVHLEADTIDGDTLGDHVFSHFADGFSFAVGVGSHTEVVVEKESIGVGLASVGEGLVHVVGESGIPGVDRFEAPFPGDAVPAHGFVDYIPGVDLLSGLELDSLHHGGDMVLQDVIQFGGGVFTFQQPLWVVVAPAKIVTTEKLLRLNATGIIQRFDT